VRELIAHDKENLPLPQSFQENGLVVTAEKRQRHGKGYPGIFVGPMHKFGTEYSKRVRGRIKAASTQLPSDSAGVVVIDCTGATWLDDDEVIDACFGDPSTVFRNGTMFEVREHGIFTERNFTRISAVVAYQRHRYTSDPGPFKMTVLHSPYARFQLPAEWLVAEHVRHMRRIEDGPGKYHFESSPPAMPDSEAEG
jgi:hypothetical protein